MDIVEEFKQVRDIPYRIPLSPEERDDSCSGKSRRLFQVFSEGGCSVRYRVCTFRWSDVSLPSEIAAVRHENESTHAYLELKVGNDWKIVDPTWDKGLSDLFAVNDWNGESDMVVAVPVEKCFSPEESQRIMAESTVPDAQIKDLAVNGDFYRSFNVWLEEKRKHRRNPHD